MMTGARLLAAVAMALALALPAGASRAQQNETLTDQGRIEQIIHDYLMAHPEVIMEAVGKYREQQERAAAANEAKALVDRREELVNAPDSPVLGNPAGDVTIVEFFDYQCPYCKAVAQPFIDAVTADGNVRIVLKEFPILGAASEYAAKTALAAQKQGKYGALHAALMAHKGKLTEEEVQRLAKEAGLDMTRLAADRDSPETAAALERNYDLAEAIGVRGTPAFVIGNELIPGAISMDELRQRISAARKG